MGTESIQYMKKNNVNYRYRGYVGFDSRKYAFCACNRNKRLGGSDHMEPHIPDTQNLSQTIPMTKPPPSFLLGHHHHAVPCSPLHLHHQFTTTTSLPPPFTLLSNLKRLKKGVFFLGLKAGPFEKCHVVTMPMR